MQVNISKLEVKIVIWEKINQKWREKCSYREGKSKGMLEIQQGLKMEGEKKLSYLG